MSWEVCDRVAHLQLQITPVIAAPGTEPHIRRYCARCKGQQPFLCSGKFRLNANGKALDAWLIYRCDSCELAWNYPIHERRAAKTFAPTELEGLMQNDRALVGRYAGDAGGLRAAGAEIVASREARVCATILRPATAESIGMLLSLVVAPSCDIRLDRVIASSLRLPRGDISDLLQRAALEIRPPSAKALKKAAVDGQQIHLSFAGAGSGIAEICRQHLAGESGETILLDL